MKRIIPKFNLKSIPKSLSPDHFNAYFVNVPADINKDFPESEQPPPWKGPESVHNFNFTYFSPKSVLVELEKLDNTPGLDILNMDRKLLYISSKIIAPSLCKTLNNTISSGFIPAIFKRARVTPVFKNGDDSDINIPSDYRPISVIAHLAKILERLIKNQLIKFLEDTKVISSDQSAYLKGHSTQTSLHRVIEDIHENIDAGEFSAACLFDISKCFDSINPRLLLSKLEKYGIRNKALDWFKSYLTDRTQAVYCHGELSCLKKVKFGVPQGSILGPFLFLLFINDISSFAANDCITNLFADDLINYASDKDPVKLQERLQNSVNGICKWYYDNRLRVNPKKSKLIIFGSKKQLLDPRLRSFSISYEGTKIPRVSDVLYLGLKITETLDWDKHITYQCGILNRKIFHLNQLRKFGCPKSLLIKIYKTYIQSKIDYALTLWGCAPQIYLRKVQRLQNRAARYISGNFDYINSRGLDILRALKLPNIHERRDYFITKLMFQSIHGLAPNYLSDRIIMKEDIRNYQLRDANDVDVYLPRANKEFFKSSLMFLGGTLWNALPSTVKNSTSLNAFKRLYKSVILPHLDKD